MAMPRLKLIRKMHVYVVENLGWMTFLIQNYIFLVL